MFIPILQVLHVCAVVCPNYDATFAMSVVWTTVQQLYCSFFVHFSVVSSTSPQLCSHTFRRLPVYVHCIKACLHYSNSSYVAVHSE